MGALLGAALVSIVAHVPWNKALSFLPLSFWVVAPSLGLGLCSLPVLIGRTKPKQPAAPDHHAASDPSAEPSPMDTDLMCPICQELLWEPVTLECQHNLCRGCSASLTASTFNPRCPTCRSSMKAFRPLSINHALQAQCQARHPVEFDERRASAARARSLDRPLLRSVRSCAHRLVTRALALQDAMTPSNGFIEGCLSAFTGLPTVITILAALVSPTGVPTRGGDGDGDLDADGATAAGGRLVDHILLNSAWTLGAHGIGLLGAEQRRAAVVGGSGSAGKSDNMAWTACCLGLALLCGRAYLALGCAPAPLLAPLQTVAAIVALVRLGGAWHLLERPRWLAHISTALQLTACATAVHLACGGAPFAAMLPAGVMLGWLCAMISLGHDGVVGCEDVGFGACVLAAFASLACVTTLHLRRHDAAAAALAFSATTTSVADRMAAALPLSPPPPLPPLSLYEDGDADATWSSSATSLAWLPWTGLQRALALLGGNGGDAMGDAGGSGGGGGAGAGLGGGRREHAAPVGSSFWGSFLLYLLVQAPPREIAFLYHAIGPLAALAAVACVHGTLARAVLDAPARAVDVGCATLPVLFSVLYRTSTEAEWRDDPAAAYSRDYNSWLAGGAPPVRRAPWWGGWARLGRAGGARWLWRAMHLAMPAASLAGERLVRTPWLAELAVWCAAACAVVSACGLKPSREPSHRDRPNAPPLPNSQAIVAMYVQLTAAVPALCALWCAHAAPGAVGAA